MPMPIALRIFSQDLAKRERRKRSSVLLRQEQPNEALELQYKVVGQLYERELLMPRLDAQVTLHANLLSKNLVEVTTDQSL